MLDRGISSTWQSLMTERWRKLKRFIFVRILHADDPPHSLALGIAIGLLIGVSPAAGLQIALSVAIAALLRANKILAAAMTWVTNPLTTVPIYYLNWKVGSYFCSTATVGNETAVQEHIARLADRTGGFSDILPHLLEQGFWSEAFQLVWALGVELWIGSAIVGLACAVPSYFMMRWAITEYRRRVPRSRLFSKSVRRRRAAHAVATARPRLQKQSA